MNPFTVSSLNPSPETDSGNGALPSQDAQTQQDAAQFEQWLQEPAASTQAAAGAEASSGKPLGQWLRDVGDGLRQREAAYFETLARASRTGDPVEGLAVQRKLSDLYLDHGLAVKVISKTAQAADSLTRLQ
ncbi:type III secretion system major needle protein, YscF/MxiH/PrgI family [Roseateles sp. YR242]|uniref:EscI/YscI/HrpB family type III secretion system inner rod protein n=1 Tax=Roseateles sp. YR242 TaxID=1855305 RepID=UPI0008BDB82C|nr:EscI/YscI/HrpB family type III secretion system inner rod protein [Roseateles sp. YR242]SEK63776.1 type III secretion system major needle protein, YscF/MxiH/PrgI family [Roseateles sp. YR242]